MSANIRQLSMPEYKSKLDGARFGFVRSKAGGDGNRMSRAGK